MPGDSLAFNVLTLTRRHMPAASAVSRVGVDPAPGIAFVLVACAEGEAFVAVFGEVASFARLRSVVDPVADGAVGGGCIGHAVHEVGEGGVRGGGPF